MALLSSIQRLTTLAGITFVQLVRMKVFVFLLFFVLLFLASNTFHFTDFLGPETAGEQELTLMKETTLGMMRLFCLIFSVAATALLIPKDSEDRILYTILCKPLPRWEYLAGKLLGLMSVILIVVVSMDILFSLVLEWRTASIIAEQTAYLTETKVDPETIKVIIGRIEAQGVTWSMQWGVVSLLLESLVLASATLFLSIISTSTIFSIIIGFSLYMIGLFQAEISSMWFGGSGSGLSRWREIGNFLISVIFPNFRLYSLMDSAIAGKVIPIALLGKITMIAGAYTLMYLSAATLIFRKKEF